MHNITTPPPLLSTQAAAQLSLSPELLYRQKVMRPIATFCRQKLQEEEWPGTFKRRARSRTLDGVGIGGGGSGGGHSRGGTAAAPDSSPRGGAAGGGKDKDKDKDKEHVQIACLLLDIYYLSEAALTAAGVEVSDILDGLLRNIAYGSYERISRGAFA